MLTITLLITRFKFTDQQNLMLNLNLNLKVNLYLNLNINLNLNLNLNWGSAQYSTSDNFFSVFLALTLFHRGGALDLAI